MKYAGLTDTGRVRSGNEDCWFADPDIGLFIVSDGMGGHNAGGLASKTVVEALSSLIKKNAAAYQNITDNEIERHLFSAIRDLSSFLRGETQNQQELSGMGATLVMAMARPPHAIIAHMGDSRAYLIRDNEIRRLTKDHSFMQMLLDKGHVKPEETWNHPAKGKLTKFVGMPGNPIPEIKLTNIKEGDKLLLCSDGLSNMISEIKILSVLEENKSDEDACRVLVEEANKAGGYDNITVVLISF